MEKDFQIVEYSSREDVHPDLMAAKVEMHFAKELSENSDVGEFVRIGVMVTCPADATREYLEQAVVDAAIARLAAALKFVEGRQARDLLTNSKQVPLRIPTDP